MKAKDIKYDEPASGCNPVRDALLEKYMLVKADKPNSCYTYAGLVCKLREMKAADLAIALKCSTVELNCETGFDLLYK